jgi:hypothetical protein
MGGSRTTWRSRRGAVVVVILGMIVLLSALMASFLARTGSDLLVVERNAGDSRLRREARSALETTLAVLAEFKAVDGALHSPAQGWGDPLGHAGLEPSPGLAVEVGFEDETGKLSLPGADSEAVGRLLEASGVDRGRASGAVRALQTWLQSDSREAGQPRTFAEWAALPGWRELIADTAGRPNDVWLRFERAASPHRLGATNLNTATAASLHALGWTAAQIRTLAQWRAESRQPAGYARDLEGLTGRLGAALAVAPAGTQIEVLRILVTVRAGPMTYRMEAVVAPGHSAPPGGGGADLRYPFRILEFHDDAERRVPPEDSP